MLLRCIKQGIVTINGEAKLPQRFAFGPKRELAFTASVSLRATEIHACHSQKMDFVRESGGDAGSEWRRLRVKTWAMLPGETLARREQRGAPGKLPKVFAEAVAPERKAPIPIEIK